MAHRRGRVETVFLHLCGRDGSAPFRGELSSGLSVRDTPDVVRRKLGPATRSGAGDPDGVWPWDRFDSDSPCLHVAYRESGDGLRMLTLMAPDVAP